MILCKKSSPYAAQAEYGLSFKARINQVTFRFYGQLQT
jgi:hypothetical protein